MTKEAKASDGGSWCNHIYCPECKAPKPLVVNEGDLLCGVCRLVVATTTMRLTTLEDEIAMGNGETEITRAAEKLPDPS